MKIAFVTTQSIHGSTVIGRVVPLASQLSKKFDVHILLHGASNRHPSEIKFHNTGQDPFTHTKKGKARYKGIHLIWLMGSNAIRIFAKLLLVNPERVIIVKPLPENVLGASLWHILHPSKKIILDVDDYELTANKLTSLAQRGVIHWSERTAAKISSVIVTASPFLSDHFSQLTRGRKKIRMIPTGITRHNINFKNHKPSHNLLYIGSVSLSSGHRVDLLPEIFYQVRQTIADTTLTIAGSGDDVQLLQKKFKQMNLPVIWLGRFNNNYISQILQSSDIILDPIDASIANRAKSSFRILAAGLFGKAAVTSNVGIRPELIPSLLHESFFAEPESTNSYAEKIIKLLENPISSEQIISLRKKAREFTWDKLSSKYERCLV